MKELDFVSDPTELRKVLHELRLSRRKAKLKLKRKSTLTKSDRIKIHSKTDGKCHVCGEEVSVEKFEADHVKSHSSGGQGYVDNFLAACKTCNNYRWDYLPDEIKWVLKLGIWSRKQIEDGSPLGISIAKQFIKYEHRREDRRKISRKSD
jgi:5-methylcytosine-specific restriction endonuclease McrA